MVNRRVTKEQIVQVAQQIVFDDGIRSLSFPLIAQKLDIRSQTLYNYFKNLQDLINQIGADFMDNLYQLFMDNLIGLSGKAAFQKYGEVAHHYFENQGKLVELVYEVHRFSHDSLFYQKTARNWQILDKLVTGVRLKHMHAKSFVQTFISSVLGFTAIEMMGFLPSEPKQRQQSFQELLALQLNEIIE